MILGASGSGKSSLALQLLALGCCLVSDDRTEVMRKGNRLLATAPIQISGLIEARGIGILNVPVVGSHPVVLIVDLDVKETDRLPEDRTTQVLDIDLPVLRKSDEPHFPAAILLYLKHNSAG